MNPILLENLTNTITLAVVIAGCVFHLATKVDYRSPECERWGFTLTAAGAFGVTITLWWPRFEQFIIGYDTFMHVGMALIAAWLVQGEIRSLIGTWPLMRWCDRRRAPRT